MCGVGFSPPDVYCLYYTPGRVGDKCRRRCRWEDLAEPCPKVGFCEIDNLPVVEMSDREKLSLQ